MLKIIRYGKNNNALHIGGLYNKLSIFFNEKCARLQLGNKSFHFGNWNKLQNTYSIKGGKTMKKTVLKIEGQLINSYYFGTLADIMGKQGDKINWSKVIATATVDENDEYPELQHNKYRDLSPV